MQAAMANRQVARMQNTYQMQDTTKAHKHSNTKARTAVWRQAQHIYNIKSALVARQQTYTPHAS